MMVGAKYKFWFSFNGSSKRTFQEFLDEQLKERQKWEANGAKVDEWTDSFCKLQQGEQGICSTDGQVITWDGSTFVAVGFDENFKDLYDRYQKALRYKDHTAFKIIERTAKADAYGRAAFYLWQHVVKDMKETDPHYNSAKHLLKFFQEKEQSHLEYLKGVPVVYDYAYQTFVPKTYPDEAESPRETEATV